MKPVLTKITADVKSTKKARSIRDDPYCTSRENGLELIELSCINKVSLVWVSSRSNTESIRDDPHWTSRKNILELIELPSINEVSLGFHRYKTNKEYPLLDF